MGGKPGPGPQEKFCRAQKPQSPVFPVKMQKTGIRLKIYSQLNGSKDEK
jgi:hypothetical protein